MGGVQEQDVEQRLAALEDEVTRLADENSRLRTVIASVAALVGPELAGDVGAVEPEQHVPLLADE